MHQYLEAIGFRKVYSCKELKKILLQVETDFTQFKNVSYYQETDFCELKKEYGQNIGIALYGEREDENFCATDYIPYFEGSGITTHAAVLVEKRLEKERYVGICEDPKVGISLIFYLQNPIDYLRCVKNGNYPKKCAVTFSGLALTGMVLFPVKPGQKFTKEEKTLAKRRQELLTEARKGDHDAIETLTLGDMDIYSKVSLRLENEDVFSIIDTYFMPYGVECDMYSILGKIMAVRERENMYTGEVLYQMKLDVNELFFDICVPKEKVLGAPEIGRRFKANIWLQGKINFL